MKVLAFDPGETTGWAYTNTEAEPSMRTGTFPMWSAVVQLIERLSPDAVIVEIFTLYAWAAQSQTWSTFPTVEVIGVIKFVCEQHHVPVRMQPASDAKALWLRKALVRGSMHEMDAQKHVLAFLKREGLHEGYRKYYTQRRKRSKTPYRPK